ncbi:hypothetical protein FEM33_10355 [Dyadobacter flavalbus]|uniref:Uncharacterized protein n=1 Tax=Dyadobacter flavalbus TaxID=2579942 RepID=A0A5M8QZL9_9BACT|nr:hypothetical protein [Dyadobacter flavalbus]KAA6439843.1 hypothetical protein FEM33_10355 [Dyadobacter flavalbus]
MKNKSFWQRIIMGSVIFMTIFLLTDYAGGKSLWISGVIVERHFRPKKTYLKKQRKKDPQGHSYNKNVRKKRPEVWYFIVKTRNGEKMKMECEKEVYLAFRPGQNIRYEIRKGLLTGFVYREKITAVR